MSFCQTLLYCSFQNTNPSGLFQGKKSLLLKMYIILKLVLLRFSAKMKLKFKKHQTLVADVM